MKNLNPIRFVPGKILLVLAGLLSAGQIHSQCNASFTYSVGASGVVQFQNTSTGTNTSSIHIWNFGDGNGTIDASPVLTHTYTYSGVYPLSLYIGSADSSCWDNYLDTLDLTNAGLPCGGNVSFNTSRDSLAPLSWKVYPYYPGNIVSATWSWGDGSTDVGLYPSHTYSAAGVYSICVTVSLSCGGTSTYCLNTAISRSSQGSSVYSINVINSTPTGIKSNSMDVIKASLYPNPTAANARVSFYSAGSALYKISVYTVDGRQVMSEMVEAGSGDNTAELTTQHLQTGLYFISLSNGKAQKTIRLIKE